MVQKVVIVDSQNRKKGARVLNGGALEIVNSSVPPQGLQQKAIIYREYFRNTTTFGTDGTQDMRVNGSSQPVEFTIAASEDPKVDRYITSLSFVIADAGAELNEFGNGSPLTNGVDLEYRNNLAPNGVVSISLQGLKTNWDFVRMANGKPAFGTGAQAFRAQNVTGTSEAFIPVVDIDEIFGLPYGIVLRGNTNDRFVIRINDDIAAPGFTPDEFTCIASGIDRIAVD